MKSVFAAILVALSIAAMMPTSAQAWYCYARGNGGYGWGRSPSKGYAIGRAMGECNARASYCHIVYCR